MQRTYIDGQLPHGLACINDVRHVMLRADAADVRGRLHQAGVGRHPRQHHDLRAVLADLGRDRRGIDTAFRRIVGALEAHAPAPGEREIHELIRHVIAARGENDVVALEVERRQRLGDCHGRVLDNGDVARLGIEQSGDCLVGSVNIGAHGVASLVTAHGGFALDMIDDGCHNRPRHERRTRVVEVHAPRFRGGCVSAPLLECIGGHGPQCEYFASLWAGKNCRGKSAAYIARFHV